MNDRDAETFSRFVRRFAAIERAIPERPDRSKNPHSRVDVRLRSLPTTSGLGLALIGVLLVAVMAAQGWIGVSPRDDPTAQNAVGSGGSSQISVAGVPATCSVEEDVCQGVAALVINNLGRLRPGGTIMIFARHACPIVPPWADVSVCWQAEIPEEDGPICMVVALRRQDGLFAQVAGDVPGLVHAPGELRGCPEDR